MSGATVGDRVGQVRADFNRSFAEPLRVLDGGIVELLAIGVGDRPYVIRLAQTAGVHPDRKITPLPSTVRGLLGVAGFAGSIVPVYDLAALLGHPKPERPRWLVLAAGTPMLALAFHQLDRHVRVQSGDMLESADEESGQGCLQGMVRLPDGNRPIVDVPATRALVHRLAGHQFDAEPHAVAEET
ncbi:MULTISPECIES: chemotaxis protein CheW [Actinoplanes]|uniref:chemotaxis protein CheW n=1 Tax=Actinoplanes TaxID=1865 RepID=UPI0005F2DF61|nr:MULTISPECIES: chemotaxis protein CheW [Actinoplanes]GLY00275.1 hypothetical protein Acsp01_06540 [Actinoplanes sp. NBRC 101535]